MNQPNRPTIDQLIKSLNLQPLPVEDGLFVQGYLSADVIAGGTSRVVTLGPDIVNSQHVVSATKLGETPRR